MSSRIVTPRILLSLLCALSIASSSFATVGGGAVAARHPMASVASETSPDSGATVEAQEAELTAEIDRQADVIFRDFLAESGSRVPLSTLKKAQRAIVYRLKQMHVLTDVMKASGPAPATTILATEILTNFVLAPIATAFGKPEVAGVVLTVPWGVVTGFGVFSFQIMKERMRLAHALKLRSLRSLDRLRKAVVGYDLKYRVSSVIYQSLAADVGDLEFEVLRQGWSDQTRVPAIQIAELESIVRVAPEGPEYLEKISMERLDSAFYSALLLRFVNENSAAMATLVSLVRARIPSSEAPAYLRAVRRHLVGISDVKAQIDRESKNLLLIRAGLKKRKKAGELTAGQVQSWKSYIADEIDRLRDIRARLMKHEYAFLLETSTEISQGATTADAGVSRAQARDLIDLALEAHTSPSEFVPTNEAVQPSILDRAVLDPVRAVVKTVTARPLVCQELFR